MPYTFGVWKSKNSGPLGFGEIQILFDDEWKRKSPVTADVSNYATVLCREFPSVPETLPSECVWSYAPDDPDSAHGNFLYVGLRMSLEDDVLNTVFDRAVVLALLHRFNVVDWQTQEIWWADQTSEV